MEPWLDASNPEQMTKRVQVWAGSASKLLCFFEIEPLLRLSSTEAYLKGLRREVGKPRHFDLGEGRVHYSMGDLTAYSQATCPGLPQLPVGLGARRKPEGFWLWSFLAWRFRCVRPARRAPGSLSQRFKA